MKKMHQLFILTAGAISLSGCAGMFGGKQARAVSDSAVDIADIYHDYAVEQLELGRKQLRGGAYAASLDALRKASRDPKTAPAAYNAMGVAYAKLNRDDVALRFFRIALLIDPENTDIASNLVRLKAQAVATPQPQRADVKKLQEAVAGQPARIASGAGKPASDSKSMPIRVKPAYGAQVSARLTSGGMQRLSRHEVFLGRQRPSSDNKKGTLAASQHPIRIEFSRTRTRKAGSAKNTASYPSRVNF